MPVIVARSVSNVSPAEELRQQLDAVEVQLAASRIAQAAGIAEIIQKIDQLDERLQELRRQTIDLRSEQLRISGLHERLTQDAVRVVRRVQASGQAGALADSPTWHMLLQVYTARRQRLQRRLLGGVGVILVLGVLLFVVVPWLFPVPPRANVDAVARQAEAGDFSGALTQAEAEQRSVPTDPSAWLWVGALQQRQGNQAAADQAWAQAQRLIDDDETFYNNRGTVLIQLGDYVAAEADARALIKLNPTGGAGYYLLGLTQSGQNKIPEALASFDKAATFADQENNGALVVAAKMETQNLLQRPPMFATPTP